VESVEEARTTSPRKFYRLTFLEDSSIAVFSTGETTVAEDAGEARTIF
jgi:hypothetical protein